MMARFNYKYILLLITTSFLPLIIHLYGQQEEEDIFTLSQFEIDESETQGYLATSTLAGTRIKTDLKDLGAAISVVTEEFMDDVGATDALTLLSYTANTEVGGIQGNFSGATDVGFGRFAQVDARTNPQNNQRVRGLLKADLTRGYFLTDIPFDSYNTGRVTVSRGPNSLLFGIGSPGGVINNGTKQAIQNENFGELGIRVDNFGSWRANFDYNKSIIEDRVSLRVALLEESQEFKQEPAYEDQSRHYAALNVVLLESDSALTRLRVNYEDGEQSGSPVEIVPPTISYDTWFEPILPNIEQYTGVVADANVRAPSDGGGTWEFQALHDEPLNNGHTRVSTSTRPLTFRHTGIWYSERGATSPDVGIPGMNLGGYNGIFNWNAGRDTAASTGLLNTPLGEALGLDPDTPVGTIQDLRTASAYGDTSYAFGFVPPTLQNREVFDFYNHVYSNGLDHVVRDFDAFNIALEQTFFDGDLGIELAYDDQSYKTFQDFLFVGGQSTALAAASDITVHNTVWLPNGQRNPNLGRAMSWVRRPTQRTDWSDRETFRITAFGEFDLSENDGLLGWLGRHRITGLYNDYTRDTYHHATALLTHSEEFNMDSAQSHRLGGGNGVGGRRSLNITAYTSDSLIGLQSMDDVRLHALDFTRPKAGDTFLFSYVDNQGAGSLNSGVAGDRMIRTNNVTIVRSDVPPFGGPDGGGISQTNIEAKAIAWQSYFLDDHIVALYGYREDDTENYAINTVAEATVPRQFADETYNQAFTALSPNPRPKVEGQPNDTQTWSVVARYPEGLLGNLPFDVQAHWSNSENFNPVGVRSNILGGPIFEPSGTTEEYGVTISTDDNKYSIKLNWFETTVSNVNAGVSTNVAGNALSRINQYRDAEIVNGIPFSTQLELYGGDAASHPIQSYDQFYDLTFNALPQSLVDTVNPRQVDLDGDGVWDEYQWDGIPNLQATRDLLAEGFELEFVANPTPSWRILANLSQQETTFANTAPLMFQVTQEYVQSSIDARLGDLRGDPNLERDAELIGVGLPLLLGPIAAQRAKDGQTSDEQREWRFTGVTSYEFQEGALNGFGIGGAVRWEDEAATGFVQIIDSETGAVIPDINRPFFDDGLFSGDAWITYSRPILDGKVNWRVQLNVRNLVGESGNIPVRTNPDGTVAVIRIPNPRTIYLSNTFKF
ncbi:MAG: TonB-dependent receptor plug domain-containing protein [Verrucomicrobiae bacterium]|nr:TonB-dependent receptor plug domain-containing protein [Verrucomicrobiae bacterium]